MALTLRILLADPSDASLCLTLDAPRVVLGRGRGCEVLLPDPTVSARHATIEQRGGKNVITDENSTNGVVVGLDRLPPRTAQPLADGEIIRVGRVWLEVRGGLGQGSEPKRAQVIARQLVERYLQRVGEPFRATVQVVEGPGRGASLVLDDAERDFTIGRSKEADLCLGGDGRLSRRHLSLAASGGDWVVRDLGSKRGGEIDGKPLTTSGSKWPAGGRVVVGESVLELIDPVAEALTEILAAPDERMRAVEYEERPPGGRPAHPRAAPEPPEPESPGGDDDGDVPADEGELAPDEHELGEPSDDEAAEGEDDERDEDADQPGANQWFETAVVLLALAVLGVSVAGLVWLLGGG